MSREIVTILWCDAEHDENQREHATASHEITLDKRGPVNLDLCDRHAKIIDGLLTLMERGAPVPTKLAAKTSSSASNQPPCPVCGHQLATRTGLNRHMKTVHGQTLAEWRRDNGAPTFSCPICGHTTTTAQGVNTHMGRSHDMTMAEYRQQQSDAEQQSEPAPA